MTESSGTTEALQPFVEEHTASALGNFVVFVALLSSTGEEPDVDFTFQQNVLTELRDTISSLPKHSSKASKRYLLESGHPCQVG